MVRNNFKIMSGDSEEEEEVNNLQKGFIYTLHIYYYYVYLVINFIINGIAGHL